MFDKIEIIGKSTIQHGKSNNRIYLLKLNPDDDPGILPELDRLANQNGYTKIFTKIQAGALPGFLLNGYKVEAYVPGFYNGKTDCIMASKFLDDRRKQIPETELKLFMELFALKGKNNNKILASKLNIRALTEKDAVAITEVFKRVFETYPFPVHDPDYILKTMNLNHASYFGIWDNDKLIGVSTAETDFEKENAEMTDFAVLPGYRGKSLALHLLTFMENEMKAAGMKTAYTIARLAEPGMNLTFMKAGYKFSGTLINNTNISGRIESMNIFYKQLF